MNVAIKLKKNLVKPLDQWGEDIIDYQNDQDPKKLDNILNGICQYIKYYPQIAFRKNDEDLQSEFFMYIMERFNDIVLKYNPESSKFSTYLSIRLKSHFLNYLKREKNKRNFDILPSSDKEFLFENKDKIYEQEYMQVAESEGNYEVYNVEDISTNFFNNLKHDTLKYLALKLYYVDFFDSNDLNLLKDYLKHDNYKNIFQKFTNFLEETQNKKAVKLCYEEKLNKLHYDLMQIENKIEKGEISQEEAEQLIEKISIKKTKSLSKYHSIKVSPSIKAIANILETDITKISNIINYYKNSIKKK